jgi:hypothetical protein
MKTMKNYFVMAAILLAAGLAFTACGGSDDDNGSGSSKNIITAGTTDYEIVAMEAIPHSVSGNDYLITFGIFGKGLTYNNSTYELTGKGPLLSFQIKMTSVDGVTTLVPGTYDALHVVWRENYAPSSSSYFKNGSMLDGNWNTAFTRSSPILTVGGTVTIAKSGDTYTITFTGSYDGTDLKSTYKGKVTIRTGAEVVEV